uniref:Uncharacterized protein n=1 Tax=Wuchereria bancrofti TaxID=6293 RepID=A0A1I8EMV8_WUCBA
MFHCLDQQGNEGNDRSLMDNLFFLLAGLSSVFTALLYMINGIVTVGLLRQNNADIEKAPKQISCTAKDDPKCFPISVINEQHGKTVEQTEELKEKPTLSIKNTSAKSINSIIFR